MSDEDTPSNVVQFTPPPLPQTADCCGTPDEFCGGCPLADVISITPEPDLIELGNVARRVMLKFFDTIEWGKYAPALGLLLDDGDVSTVVALMRNADIDVFFPMVDACGDHRG